MVYPDQHERHNVALWDLLFGPVQAHCCTLEYGADAYGQVLARYRF